MTKLSVVALSLLLAGPAFAADRDTQAASRTGLQVVSAERVAVARTDDVLFGRGDWSLGMADPVPQDSSVLR